jgi:hypothetical protein
MSKGLGRIQHLILNELNVRPCFYLVELLQGQDNEAEYQSLYRAFRRLLECGLVDCVRYMCGHEKVLVMRPGMSKPEKRLSVERVPTSAPPKHLTTLIEYLSTFKCLTDNSMKASKHLNAK